MSETENLSSMESPAHGLPNRNDLGAPCSSQLPEVSGTDGQTSQPEPTPIQSNQPSPAELAGQPMQDPTQSWLSARLIPRAELKFDVRETRNKPHVVIEDPVRSKFFQVGVDEYQLMASLDGTQTVQEVADSLAVDSATAIKVAQWLVQNNLAFSQDTESSKRLESQANSLQRAKLMGLFNPISCKFKLFNPNQILATIQPYTQWLFSGWMLLVWIATSAWALSILIGDWEKMGSASTGIFSGDKWIWLLVTWLGLKIVHEAAHGIACRRYGGEVPEAGVLLLLFTPMAYVNVTSMWRFSNRWHRIVVAAAGMYVELFISFVSLILWHYHPGVIGDIAFNVFIMASVTTILFNANPLMRFDGYFMLSDLLQIPNLYPKGTRWFGDRFKSLFFGIPKTPNLCSPHELRHVAVYGAMAYFWKTTICLSLMIGASVLFHGAGIALAVAGGVLWFGLPAIKHYKALFGPDAIQQVDRRRLAISLTVTGFAIFCLFGVMKAPATKSAPAIVQFSDEQIVRAAADGFVREIFVENGQSVSVGQTLIVMENRQLALEVRELELRAQVAKIESRIKIQAGELALAQSASEQFESYQQQLAEKQVQLNGLTIRAPFDGFVYQRNLEQDINSFANRGDPLLTLARAETKEVVVSIDQRDLDSISGNEGKFLRVAFPGRRVFESKLIRINPRASATPQHPSLCANAGGQLPVKAVAHAGGDQPQFELLTPRFTVDLELDSEIGSSLQSGQRGRAFFATHRQSLGSYLYVAVSDWLKHKLKAATQTAAF